MKKPDKLKIISLLLLLAITILSGCVTTPESKKESDAVFYPPPPAPPRLQFLRSFTTSQDITGALSGFDSFLTGNESQGYHLVKPYGVGLRNGKLYVCDSQASVEIFDLKNKKFYRMEGAKGLGKVVEPLNIAYDDQDNKFVSDPVRGEVLMFDAGDFYIKSFGLPGRWKPVDSAPCEGLLYVVDSLGREIKVFDIKTAEKIKSFGQGGGKQANDNLGLPTGIAIGSDKLLYISDSGRFQVVVYDRDGHQRRAIGRPGANLGHFARPRGIAIDRQNRVYIVDAAFENVQVFRDDGQLLFFFGGSGDRPGNLFLPADVAVDYDNIEYFRQYADPNFDIEHLVIVSSQFGKRLINVYGFGRQKGRTYPSEKEMEEKIKEKFKKWARDSEKEKEQK